MYTLATEMANEQQQSHIRNAAGIAIKNALTGRVGLALIIPTSRRESLLTRSPDHL
jgi:hypothetical protein